MIALTYLSTAVEPFDEDRLTALLTHAREKNESRGLTGALLYADGRFIQTLEGEADEVEALFATIQGDERHRAVRVMLRETVRERSFADWSMGFERLSEEDSGRLPGFNDFLQSDEAQRDPNLRHSRAGIYYRMFTNGPW